MWGYLLRQCWNYQERAKKIYKIDEKYTHAHVSVSKPYGNQVWATCGSLPCIVHSLCRLEGKNKRVDSCNHSWWVDHDRLHPRKCSPWKSHFMHTSYYTLYIHVHVHRLHLCIKSKNIWPSRRSAGSLEWLLRQRNDYVPKARNRVTLASSIW